MVNLKTLDEDGKPPKSRVGCASQARQFVERLRYDEEQRSSRRTKIQGLLDGNQPWSPKTLRDKQQGHRTNFNLREGEGAVEAAKTPYYDLVFEVPRFADITLDLYEEDREINLEWGNIIADEYHETLDRWDDFDRITQLHQWEMVVFGIGPVFWPHELDWRSEAIKVGRVLVPYRTKASVEKLEVVVVLHDYNCTTLFKLTENESASKSQGWDVKLVKQEIMDAHNQQWWPTGRANSWERYQRAYRAGDIFHGSGQSEIVKVASLFVKEFSGKISHYIIGSTPDIAEKADDVTDLDNEKETGYLFKKKDRFESFSQIICPFFFDTGPDGTWHSIKGLGPKIFDFCDYSNRTFCQMSDGAIIGSGITLETQDANSLQETQLILLGGATVVGPGYKVVQTRIAESLNGSLMLRREAQNTMQSNTGSYKQRVAGENQEPTLGQAQLNAQQQALLSKGAVNRYYNNLDKWHKETLRRLLDNRINKKTPGGEEALDFRERCIKRGVPEEVLDFDHICRVKAVRSLGYGSPQMRDIATKELVQLMPMFDEVSKNNALRARVSAIPGVGQAMVDLYVPSINKKKQPEDHVWDAVVENNALRTLGGEVVVTARQNQPTHFQVHFSDVMEHVKQMQTSDEAPHDVLIHMEQAGPHLRQHLDRMPDQIPGPDGKMEENQEKAGMEKAWEGLAKAADHLHQEVDKINQTSAENAPQKPEMPPELMAMMAKVQGELLIKAKKTEGDMALKEQKQKQTLRLKDIQTASELRRQNLKQPVAA